MFRFIFKLCGGMRANAVRSSDVPVEAASASSVDASVDAGPEVPAEVRADGREHEEPISEWELVQDSDEERSESAPSLFDSSDDDALVESSYGNVGQPSHFHEENPVRKTLKALFGRVVTWL